MYLGKISASDGMRSNENIYAEIKKGESSWCWGSPFQDGYQNNILGFLGELILKISWRYQRICKESILVLQFGINFIDRIEYQNR